MTVATDLNGSVPAAQLGTIDSNGVRTGVFEATQVGPAGNRKTVLTLVNQTVALVDDAGVEAYGLKQLYDFPAGLLMWEGAVMRLDITKSSTGVNTDWDGDIGLGTVAAAAGATLATTEQDLVPTTPTPQAVAGVTTGDALSTSTEAPKLFNGTATAKDMYLNVLVDDADQDVTGTACNLIFNGTITFYWRLLGDV